VSKSIESLARRVENDPFFLASLLADYARSEAMDDPRLAAALGCRPEDLAAVRLCRAPRPDREGFRADIDHIAARFKLDPDRLTEAVRRGEAMRRLRSATPGAQGFLAAAREGVSQSEPPSPPGDEP
jgi:hypothetical protein